MAAAAVGCLIGEGHTGRTYTLTGPAAVTFAGVAGELSAATGRAVTYVDVSDEDAGVFAPAEAPALRFS